MFKPAAFLLLLAALLGASPSAAQVAPFTSEVGKGVPSMTAETRARGQAIMEDLGWAPDFYPGLGNGFRDFSIEHLFAGLYGRSGLSPRERELVIMGVIITQGGGEGLVPHFGRAAPRLGISEENLREVIYTTCIYAGWPKCSGADHIFNRVLTDTPDWPKSLRVGGPAAKAAAIQSDPVAEVRAQTDRYYEAVNRADGKALAAFVAPDAVVIHSNGGVQLGVDFIAGTVASKPQFSGLSDFSAHAFGDTVVTTSRVDAKFGGPTPVVKAFRITNVWRRGANGWRLAQLQSTLIPAP